MTEPRHSGEFERGQSDRVSPKPVSEDEAPRSEPGRRPRPSPTAALWGLALWLALVELLWFVLRALIGLAN